MDKLWILLSKTNIELSPIGDATITDMGLRPIRRNISIDTSLFRAHVLLINRPEVGNWVAAQINFAMMGERFRNYIFFVENTLSPLSLLWVSWTSCNLDLKGQNEQRGSILQFALVLKKSFRMDNRADPCQIDQRKQFRTTMLIPYPLGISTRCCFDKIWVKY
jgi:hypothetical protein